jgi:hypothetical protein
LCTYSYKYGIIEYIKNKGLKEMASKVRMILKEGKPMSGEEIAKAEGTTRQYISNTLKSAMGKAFIQAQKQFPDMSPYEVAKQMITLFQVDDDDVGNFYNLFPPSIREIIKKDAVNFLGKKPKK